MAFLYINKTASANKLMLSKPMKLLKLFLFYLSKNSISFCLMTETDAI